MRPAVLVVSQAVMVLGVVVIGGGVDVQRRNAS
jgi:hypothetical protein